MSFSQRALAGSIAQGLSIALAGNPVLGVQLLKRYHHILSDLSGISENIVHISKRKSSQNIPPDSIFRSLFSKSYVQNILPDLRRTRIPSSQEGQTPAKTKAHTPPIRIRLRPQADR